MKGREERRCEAGGEGGTEEEEEGGRRHRAPVPGAAIAPASVGEIRRERDAKRREEGVRSGKENPKLAYIFDYMDSNEKRLKQVRSERI